MSIVIVLLLMLLVGLVTARSYETFYEMRFQDLEHRLLELELNPVCNKGEPK